MMSRNVPLDNVKQMLIESTIISSDIEAILDAELEFEWDIDHLFYDLEKTKGQDYF